MDFRQEGSVSLTEVMFEYKNETRPVHSICIQASACIYVDCDLNLPGVSVALQASKIYIIGKRTFKLNGKEAKAPAPKPKKAKDAASRGPSYMHGEDGVGGEDGAPGGSGGHFYLHGRILSEHPEESMLTVHCQGAPGGQAQSGGDGGRGRDGARGTPAKKPDNSTGSTGPFGHVSVFPWETGD